ncbi:MAG: sterol desaturase family protein [Bacteroidota bacterium]
MKSYKISNKGTTELFQNKLLESLTRTNILVPVLFYFLSGAAILIYADTIVKDDIWKAVYLVPLGILSFTLVEYMIHRFLFHFEPKNERQKELKFKIHGVHHAFPRDKDRLAMPPVISICIGILFYVVFKWVLKEEVWLFFPGFLTGYSIYLIIHYSIHRFRPPANFLKILWTHHSLHHYKDENSAFGVSLPLWDYIFRTLPENKNV